MKGTVKFFNDKKKFGFIKGEDEKEYFVHVTDVQDQASLAENDSVDFEPEQGERGLKATNVSLGE